MASPVLLVQMRTAPTSLSGVELALGVAVLKIATLLPGCVEVAGRDKELLVEIIFVGELLLFPSNVDVGIVSTPVAVLSSVVVIVTGAVSGCDSLVGGREWLKPVVGTTFREAEVVAGSREVVGIAQVEDVAGAGLRVVVWCV